MYKIYIYKYFTYQKLTEVVFYVFSGISTADRIYDPVDREPGRFLWIGDQPDHQAGCRHQRVDTVPDPEKTGKGGLRDDVFRRVPGQKTEVLFDHRSRKNTDGVPAGRMEVLP